MEHSQSHLIDILQEQLIEAREAEKNLRRVNNSLMMALESQPNSNPLEHTIVRELEKKWETETERKIK